MYLKEFKASIHKEIKIQTVSCHFWQKTFSLMEVDSSIPENYFIILRLLFAVSDNLSIL